MVEKKEKLEKIEKAIERVTKVIASYKEALEYMETIKNYPDKEKHRKWFEEDIIEHEIVLDCLNEYKEVIENA